MTSKLDRRRVWGLIATLVIFAGCATTPDAPSAAPEAKTAAMADAVDPEAAEAASPVEEPTEYKNTIKWATASEDENFGFDVYRGDSADGPFERINPDVIEGGGTTGEPQRYEYADDTIDPHRTYYYYVESISMGGVRERFTPIGKAPPKIPPADAEDD